MMTEQNADLTWLDDLTRRIPASGLLFALDVIEPIAPIAAGALWVVQPLAGTMINQTHLAYLAEYLERADGVSALRRHLEERTP